ncbi:cyanophycinase [bacterium A37T11]|nr:cyanophycinase [bacterium A37T11]
MNNFSTWGCTLLYLFFCNCLAAQQPAPKGNLFIIGGGERPPALMHQLMRTAKLAEDSYIVVLPMASSEPDSAFYYIQRELRQICKNPIYLLNFLKQDTANLQKIDSLRHAGLIYISGGDQNRFMEIVGSGPIYKAIHTAYSSGSTIAGTSAGAAVMSEQMITGKQLKGDTSYRETFEKIWNANIQFKKGLGLLKHIIIDQHFIKRSRYNRLISALAAYPTYTCIGIDEGTALIVEPHKLTVSGKSQVLVISQPKELKIRGELITFRGLKISLFADGDEITYNQH